MSSGVSGSLEGWLLGPGSGPFRDTPEGCPRGASNARCYPGLERAMSRAQDERVIMMCPEPRRAVDSHYESTCESRVSAEMARTSFERSLPLWTSRGRCRQYRSKQTISHGSSSSSMLLSTIPMMKDKVRTRQELWSSLILFAFRQAGKNRSLA